MDERKAIYTFIIGDYDDLKTPNIITKGWDYICFTDNSNLSSDIWEIRYTQRLASEFNLENKKFAMRHMILCYEYLRGYDLTLSIGGQIQINCDLDQFVSNQFHEKDDMLVCVHHERNCIYDEAAICKLYSIDLPERIDSQMKKYQEEGYPPNHGLYETGVMGIRHNRPSLEIMCNIWWNEVKFGSKRDQLSLNYAIWKAPKIQVSELNYNDLFLESKLFIIHHTSHKK